MMSQKTLAAVVVAAASLSAQLAAAVSPTADEMAAARQWVAARLEGGQQAQTPEPFFSFNYGGKPATELLKTWKLKRANRRLDDQRVERTLTYTDRATGLVVRCVGIEYLDYPNVEWTLFFKNTGNKDTPILSDIQALDLRVERKPQVGGDKGEFLLHHNTGSQTQPSDYQPHQTTLGPGAELILAAAAGRPTDPHLSYYNLELSPNQGIIFALGWPGQLATRLNRDKGIGVRIRAGQELTHFKLLPGEEVRSPLVALQFWNGGDWLRAQNVWRRWFIAHNIRRPGGKLPPAQWCGGAGGMA